MSRFPNPAPPVGALSGLRFLGWLLVVVCLLLGVLRAEEELVPAFPAAQPEEGLPFSRVMGRFQSTHGSLAMDSAGRIYINGVGGVHCFDGHAWHTIPVPGALEIRRLAVDSQNRIWVGGNNELGWLNPEPDGTHSYHSIMALVPETHRDFGLLYDVHVLGEEIFFSTSSRVFRLRHGALRVWEMQSMRRIFSSSFDGKNLYVHVRREPGLLCFTEGQEGPTLLVPDAAIPQGFRGGGIITVLPGEQGQLIFGLAADGVLQMDSAGHVKDAGWSLDTFLRHNHIECSLPLSDGSLALGTLRSGVVIVARDGTPLRVLKKSQGVLLDDMVIALLEPSPGRLWVATKLGISECDLRPGLSRFDERCGPGGDPLSLRRIQETLLLGSDGGLFQMQPSLRWDQTATFVTAPFQQNYVRALLPAGDGFLMLHIGGLTYLPHPQSLREARGVDWLCPDTNHSGDDLISPGPERIIVARGATLSSLDLINGRWALVAQLSLPQMRRIMLDPGDSKSCLVLSKVENVSRVFPLGPVGQTPQLLYQGAVHGPVISLFEQGGQAYVYSSTGVWRLAAGGKAFEHMQENERPQRVWAGPGAPDSSRGWMVSRVEPQDVSQEEPSCYVLRSALADRVIGWRETGPVLAYLHGLGALNTVWVDQGDVLWLAGSACIIRVDTKGLPRPSEAVLPAPSWTSVRQGVVRFDLRGVPSPQLGQVPDLEFCWSLPSWGNPDPCRFQTRLLGEADVWGPAQTDRRKLLQRLSPGSYRFEVRAMDLLGRPGATLGYDFVILTLWYQTWWARLVALSLCGVLVYGLVKWRTHHLRRRQEELELTVARRTRELLQSNAMLHRATVAKTEFVRTVSHELRTPLAGARMMSELLLRGSLAERQREQAEKLGGCVNYLQRLLDNTLDYSRIESGQVPCQLTRFGVYSLLRDTAGLFEALAERKGLRYELDFSAVEGLWCLAEATHLQRVLVNFLSNAFKFTSSGRVRFRVAPMAREGAVPYYRIEILDTGLGVPPEIRSHLFTPFVRNTSAREELGEQGAGMGLALCRRLAELNGARVGEYGPAEGGSCFWVEWPLLPASADPEAPAADELDFSGLRLLVVEDDRVQREGLDQLLQQLGVSAALAENCDQAEKLLCGQPFDLVLADYNLGAQTAINLLERCRLAGFGGQKPPRFHLLTAQDLSGVRAAGSAAGIFNLYPKPLSLSLLYTILAEQISPST